MVPSFVGTEGHVIKYNAGSKCQTKIRRERRNYSCMGIITPSVIIENSDLQRQLTSFLLLPGYQWGDQCTTEPLDSRRIFSEREIESPDERNEECLDFNNAIPGCESIIA